VVRDNFIDAVSEQAETLNGDAEALIQALRDRKVARFQQAKADELEGGSGITATLLMSCRSRASSGNSRCSGRQGMWLCLARSRW